MWAFKDHLICAGTQRNKEFLEVTPHSFLFCWKSMSRHFSLLRLCHPPSFFAEWWKMAGRSRHTVSFFAENPRVKNGREVAPHDFLFRRKSASRHFLVAHDFLFRSQPRGKGPRVLPQKESHVLFRSTKGIPHGSTRAHPAPDDTAPALHPLP